MTITRASKIVLLLVLAAHISVLGHSSYPCFCSHLIDFAIVVNTEIKKGPKVDIQGISHY